MKPVDIIVLSYNTRDYTVRCLRWLKRHTRYENFRVFVLDNGSTDGSREALVGLCEESGFIFIQNETNVGVSRGWNQVVKIIAGGDPKGYQGLENRYICLLNSDTLVAYGWLTVLVQLIETREEIGIASFGNLTNPNCFGVCEVDNLSFVCPLIKGEVFQEIGLFDERLFAYFQDNLFIDRAREAGFKTFVTPENLIFHFGNASGNQLENLGAVIERDKQTLSEILSG